LFRLGPLKGQSGPSHHWTKIEGIHFQRYKAPYRDLLISDDARFILKRTDQVWQISVDARKFWEALSSGLSTPPRMRCAKRFSDWVQEKSTSSPKILIVKVIKHVLLWPIPQR
jgi:hypothetical protein